MNVYNVHPASIPAAPEPPDSLVRITSNAAQGWAVVHAAAGMRTESDASRLWLHVGAALTLFAHVRVDLVPLDGMTPCFADRLTRLITDDDLTHPHATLVIRSADPGQCAMVQRGFERAAPGTAPEKGGV